MIKHVWPAIVWSLLIGSLILVPGGQMPKGQGNFDKWIHGFVFACAAYLWLVGLKKQRKHLVVRKYALEVTLGICLIYGTMLEVFQVSLIKGRTFEEGDLIANVCGGLIGIALFYLIYGKTVITN